MKFLFARKEDKPALKKRALASTVAEKLLTDEGSNRLSATEQKAAVAIRKSQRTCPRLARATGAGEKASCPQA
ncbi:MAG: hypothetical protein LUG19_03965 [Desulfovibrio sp.]|uniref:hypothetical protein n=1 Tax=Desulfovibrio sp. TaxID=885 RepID=UPI00258D64C0|nr:hypothetical protein [Desulfovibrio sp.]MCD7983396.1 hypothetical protein [Desulfovibrio sp.]